MSLARQRAQITELPFYFSKRGNVLIASVRTAVVTMSPLVTDIIKQVMTGHIGLDVVLEVDTRDFLEQRLQVSAPDLVLVGLRARETDAVALSVLALLPAAKVIAFSGDARQAYVHEMRPHRAALIDVSPQALIDAIRGPSPTSKS